MLLPVCSVQAYAAAATYTVTVLSDPTTGTAANCTAGSTTDANCSLRDAFAAANALIAVRNNQATIQFLPALTSAGPATLTISRPLTLSNTVTGTLVTINGPGAALLTIDGNNRTQLFVNTTTSMQFRLNNMTLAHGHAVAFGGAISLSGTGNISIQNVNFIENSAGCNGAGASGGGGAIYQGGTTAVFLNSVSFISNSASGSGVTCYGGAFYAPSGGIYTQQGATFYHNSSSNYGGAIALTGSVTKNLLGVTFLGDTAPTGNAYYNTGSTPDANGTVFTETYSGSLTSSTGGNVTDVAANFSVPGSYGGSTGVLVALPLPGSPAIRGGIAGAYNGTVDVRGNPRPAIVGGVSYYDAGAAQTDYSIVFVQQPTNSSVGALIAPAPTVQLSDAGTNVSLAGASLTVTAAAGTMSGSATVSTNSSGLATFSGLSIGSAQSTDSLTVAGPASSYISPVTSNTFMVTQAVNHLGLSGLPSLATAGTAINGTVTAYSDSGTTIATSYTGPVVVTSSDSFASVPSNLTLANGTANFSVVLKTTPSVTITAADSSGTPSVTSGSISVSSGAGATINAATGSGQSAVISNAFANPLVVQTLDAYGNPVGGITVNLIIPTSGAGLRGGTYQCTTNIAATPTGSCGITATANGITGSYTVSALSGALTSTTFSLTNIAPPPAASGGFGGSSYPSPTYASIFNAQINGSNNMVVGDQTSSTRYPFNALTLSGSSYTNAQLTSLTVADFNGVGISDAGGLTYCYYNSNTNRINTRLPNGSGGYTPTYNIYQSGTTSARCTSASDGTIYHVPGDGTLNVAVPDGSSFTVTGVSGAPGGVVGVSMGYNGNLILSATGGTYLGRVAAGVWSGSLVTPRQFYKYAVYQDITGKVYLEDATTHGGYQYALSGGSYTESAWTKPFSTDAVAYSSNNSGTVMVATPTSIKLQFPSSLMFPAVAVGNSDPVEQLVFVVSTAGALGTVSVAVAGGATDFVDAGTGSCTTNGPSHAYAVGDLCTVDVRFTPTRGGTRTGLVTITSASNTTIASASLTGVGIGDAVDHLSFTNVPTVAAPGTSFSVTVTAYKDAGTTIATFVNGTSATVSSSDTAATLPTNVSFVNGVATFNVTLNTTGTKTISLVDDAGSATVTSAGISVASVDHFGLTGLVSSTTAGTSFSGTVTAYRDAGSTIATSYTGPVKIVSSDANAGLPTNFTLTNGTANFNVTLKTAGTQTITASDAGGSFPVTSGNIAVSAGAAAKVVASSGNNQSAIITNAFANPLVLQTTDAYDNPVGAQTVNLVIPTSGAGLQGGTYQCTTSASATPAASCSININANGTTGGYSVSAQSGGLTAASFSLTNNAKTAQTITFANPGAQNFGSTPTMTASATSSLAVSFASSTTGVCSVTSGGVLTFIAAGTCTINADQAGNSTYAAATQVSRSFTVNAIAPEAPTIGSATAGNQQAIVSFTSPTATGGSAITGYTVTSNPDNITATGTGSPITITGLTNGRTYAFTVVAMNIAGNGTASGVSNSVIPSGTQTITFANPGTQTFAATPTLTASSTSSLAVSFTSSTPGVCTVTNVGVLAFTATGTCSISADQAGNSSYNPATTVTQSFTVQAASQAITFTQPTSPVIFGVSPITLSATGGAGGNAVTFTLISGPGSVSGNTLTVSGAGTIVVAADQAGNSNYNPATQVQRSVVVNAASQTVTFTPLTTPLVYGDIPTVSLSATATSGLTPTFSLVSGPGSVVGTTLNITGAGTIVVAADQTGDANYSAATRVQQSIVVNAASQTITFVQPASPIIYGSATTVALSASGGASSNPVAFSVASGPGSISGSTLTTTGAGTIVVNANQAGNGNYAAAAPVQRSTVVSKASATLTGPTASMFVVYRQAGIVPVSIAGQYSGTGIVPPSGNISYTITNASNSQVATGSLAIALGAVSVPVVSTLSPGPYTVSASYAGDANYNAATTVTAQLQVGHIQPVISWTNPSAIMYGTNLSSALNAQAKDGSPNIAGTYSYMNGSTAVTASTVLPAGTYVLTVNFAPTDTVTYKAATASVPMVVSKATPSVSLQSSVSTVLTTNPVTLTATVASTVSTPTGTVAFVDGSSQVGTVSLVNGVATLTTSSLAIGSHGITAVYAGDSNFASASTAGSTPVQVNDFSLTLSISATTTAGTSTTQTVLPGGQAVYNFTITPTGATSFPSAVNLTVSGLPTGATYTISPTTIAAGSGATNITLTVNLPKELARLQTGEKFAPLAVAILLLPFSGRIRRRAKRLTQLAILLLLLTGVGALTGCGSSTGLFAAAQKSYNVVITGTSGSLSRSTTVTLNVQ